VNGEHAIHLYFKLYLYVSRNKRYICVDSIKLLRFKEFLLFKVNALYICKYKHSTL